MVKNITYKLTFIDRTRFMPSSLSHLVGNCSEKKMKKLNVNTDTIIKL